MKVVTSQGTLSAKCKKHPRYKAVKSPRCTCTACILMWHLRRDWQRAGRDADIMKRNKK